MLSIETVILTAAKVAKVSGSLLMAICVTESGLNPHALLPVDGKTPTYGICQIKLETAEMIGFKGDSRELMKPDTNALWAASYLKYQLDRYEQNWLKATSAYNMGSFKESSKAANCPVNHRYVKSVQRHMTQNKEKLNCGTEAEIIAGSNI